ncbi:MAG: error-prone DNA polymerase [Thermoleophilia bacterium]
MGASTSYVELHCHSAYSFLDGVAQPDELVDRAAALGYSALALTDHDNLCAALPFAHAAQAAGLQAITGCELTVSDAGQAFHLVLLAETRVGYTNLCRLITAAHAGTRREDGAVGHTPSVDFLHVLEHAEGLTCLTGCPRQGALVGNDDPTARRRRDLLLEAFSTRLAIELQRPFQQGAEPELRRLSRLAHERSIPLVATNNVHLHLRRRGPLQDVLVAIRHHLALDACTSALRGNREHVLKSPTEMARLFEELPEAILETSRIAERCRFDLTESLGYQPPARAGNADHELAGFCRTHLDSRYPRSSPWRQQAEQRLETELALIQRHQLAGFFLLHHEILELAREVALELRGSDAARNVLPPGRGRGSSVGSIVCYLTGLSHIDPVAGRLSLGRFLNEELASTPDIDLDFPRDIRAELIRRIHLRFGPQQAALVGAFSTYRARGAIREIGKALALPTGDIARLAAGSDGWRAESVGEELRRIPSLRDRANDPRLRLLVALCRQISGLPRHLSQHPGGMIVSDRPLSELVPLQPAAMAGRTICQWDKDACADAGFLKIDLLGLGMLSAVERCVSEIHRSTGETVDLSRVPLDDAEVYAEIQDADTVGVFQIESRAQMQTLLRVQPTCLDDLVVEVALVRPGPIQGGAVNPYIQRRLARRADPTVPIPYEHPLLEEALHETLGVIIFQDQVLTVAQALAGFTPGQAEALRRAMSRRRSRAAIEAQWLAFAEGAAERGVPEHVAQRVFQQIIAFSAFGFPKSHAAAFALLAYQSAWLRRHHPAAFLCALLMEQPMGFYPPATLIRDAEHRAVAVLPVDIEHSLAEASCESPSAVRLGFRQVIGLGADDAEHLVTERHIRGPFHTVSELANRLDLPTTQLQRLIAAGACDRFGPRRQLLWELGLATRPQASPAGRQLAFDLQLGEVPQTLPVPNAWELLVADYATTGVSVREHPIAQLRPALVDVVSSAQLEQLPDGTPIRIPGLAVARQRPGSAKGIVFLLLEDEYGLFNLVIMPDVYEQHRLLVRSEPLLLVEGILEHRGRQLNIRVTHLNALGTPDRHVLPPQQEKDGGTLRSVAPAPQHFAQGRRRA